MMLALIKKDVTKFTSIKKCFRVLKS